MASLERRLEEVGALLGDPEIIGKRGEFTKLSREHAELDPLVGAWKKYQKLIDELAQARELAATADGELKELAQDELKELEAEREKAEQELKILLLPKDSK